MRYAYCGLALKTGDLYDRGILYYRFTFENPVWSVSSVARKKSVYRVSQTFLETNISLGIVFILTCLEYYFLCLIFSGRLTTWTSEKKLNTCLIPKFSICILPSTVVLLAHFSVQISYILHVTVHHVTTDYFFSDTVAYSFESFLQV